MEVQQGDLKQQFMDAKPIFQEGCLRYDIPGFEGEIDINLEQAKVIIVSNRPLEALDYFLRTLYALLAYEKGGFLFHAAGGDFLADQSDAVGSGSPPTAALIEMSPASITPS